MHPLFKNTTFSEQLKIVKFRRQDCIFSEDERCEYLGLVLKGSVEIKTFSSLENEYTIRIIKEGSLFGEFLLFSDAPYYFGSGYALRDCEICFISREQLLNLLNNKTILENLLSIISKITIELQNSVKILSQKSLRDKVLFYLNERKRALNSKKIPIDSKENLARRLNVPRPSLSRELSNLKREGYIDYDRHYIVIKY